MNRDAAARDEALRNRLGGNLRHFRRRFRRAGVDAWRLFDGDLPEYPAAVDVYADCLVIHERAPPKDVDPERAAARRIELRAALEEVTGVPSERIFLQLRERRRGGAAGDEPRGAGLVRLVAEGPCRFEVHLGERLDTGVFLDHRPLRARILQEAAGQRFLNLFAYTGTASVAAARGGARATTSVDLSPTYLAWAEKNLEHNGFRAGPQHRLERADCRSWLEASREAFDLVLLDPPTFSLSKRAPAPFDVQQEHVALIRAVMARLAPAGRLYFSCNRRDFRLDGAALADLDVRDVTAATIPEDFRRRPRVHQCFLVRRRAPP